MRVIIDFDSIDAESSQAEILKEWIDGLIKDKAEDNLSPLRYADRFEVVPKGKQINDRGDCRRCEESINNTVPERDKCKGMVFKADVQH